MSWAVFAVTLGTLVMLVPLMMFAPEMSRPTVPLGVSVPSAYVEHPVVVAAKRRFRRACLVHGGVAFARCRRPIQRAKADEGWYDGVPVRVFASVTPVQRPVKVLWPVHALALALLLGVLVLDIAQFHRLPDPYPAHGDLLGHVDRWEPRSWAGVLAMPALGLLVALSLAVTCWLQARRPQPVLPDGDLDQARAGAERKARLMQQTLAWVSLGVALTFVGVDRWAAHGGPNAWASALEGAGLLLMLVVPLVLAWRSRRPVPMPDRPGATGAAGPGAAGEPGSSAQAGDPASAPGPESPDDDRFWKWGLFYVNRDDPRASVPKRLGWGFDVNWGNPLGAGLMVALLALPLIALLVDALTG